MNKFLNQFFLPNRLFGIAWILSLSTNPVSSRRALIRNTLFMTVS